MERWSIIESAAREMCPFIIQIEQVLVPRMIASTTMRITQIFFFI